MNKPLIPAQRRERILEYLALHKIVRNADLIAMLTSSEATIRRDLEWLESEGFLERTHGGAILSQRIDLEPEYLARTQRFPEEKRLIGAMAASLVEPGDIIFINSGTTTTQLIRQIRPGVDITVITNNLSAALEVGDAGFEIILLGGSFQPKSNSVAGRFAINNLSQIYADKTFIGVDGLNLKYGCTVPTNAEAEVVRIMITRSHGPITVLADHSKWGVVSNFEIAKIDEIDQLITDEGFDASARAALSDYSIAIMIANGKLNTT